MGKEDVVLNQYYDNAERFADLFNGILFRGKDVIHPEDLRDGSERYNTVDSDFTEKRYGVRFRDIKKYLENGTTLRILALENQMFVDYSMPWRCMDYDTKEYGKQLEVLRDKNSVMQAGSSSAEWLCRLRKEDRLSPTYTICLYHGEEKWDGPRSLKDMMNFGEDGECWAEWFSDYPLQLICVNELQDLERFHSSLKEFFAALQCRDDKRKMLELLNSDEAYRNLDEATMEAMVILLKDKKLLEKVDNYRDDEGGTYNMCKALTDLYEDGVSQGISQGNISKTRTVIRNMLARNMSDEDIMVIAECGMELIEEVRKSSS